jgi:tetratricopeptide (TPR) repeat protein
MSTLKLLVAWSTLMSVLLGAAGADYFTDRQAAAALLQAGKPAEAMERFLAMASADVGAERRSDALTQAVHCGMAVKQWDRAADLAKQIPLEHPSKLAQMMVLHAHANRRFPELLDRFAGEDLSRWPEHVAAQAWLMRGQAAASEGKHFKLAVTDLTMALRFPMDTRTRAQTLNLLAGVHVRLGQEDEAIALYEQVCAMTDPYRAANAAISLANILAARGEHARVVTVIQAIPLDKISPGSIRTGLLPAMGDALAAAGDREGAIARYRQAIAEHGDSGQYKAACEAKISALRAK